jgi:hypothetical protein
MECADPNVLPGRALIERPSIDLGATLVMRDCLHHLSAPPGS